jgi:hypothetical protein
VVIVAPALVTLVTVVVTVPFGFVTVVVVVFVLAFRLVVVVTPFEVVVPGVSFVDSGEDGWLLFG